MTLEMHYKLVILLGLQEGKIVGKSMFELTFLGDFNHKIEKL